MEVEEKKEKKRPKKKGKKAQPEVEEKEMEREEEKGAEGVAIDYSAMNVTQLREQSKAESLPATGTKAVLVDRLTQHAAVREKDRAAAAAALLARSSSSPSTFSSSSSRSPTSADPVEVEFEKQLKDESALRWSIRDPLKSSLSTSQLKAILASFDYPTNGGPDRLLDTLTDLMMYGVAPPCPECGKVGVYYKDGAFRCGGFANEWARCGWTADQVEREEFVVPEGYEDVPPFDSYEWKAREKPVEAHQHQAKKAAAKTGEMAQKAEARAAQQAEAKAKKDREEAERNVLMGLKLALHGKAFTLSAAELKVLITQRGGEALKSAKGANALISTAEAVQEGKGKPLKDAESDGIVVLSEQWLHDSLSKGEVQPIKAYVLAQQSGVDALTKLIDERQAQKKAALLSSSSKSSSSSASGKSTGFGKSGGKSGKIKLKKGARAAVDADSKLDETGHIVEESEREVYSVTMSAADVKSGANTYYILQLIELDAGNAWYVFRKWGRLGTEQGNSKLEAFGSKAKAKEVFSDVYRDKTGNEWAERHSFRKRPGKFTVLEQDYSMEDELQGLGEDAAKGNSKLPESVQAVVKMFFDVKAMQRTLLEMEIDMEKSAQRSAVQCSGVECSSREASHPPLRVTQTLRAHSDLLSSRCAAVPHRVTATHRTGTPRCRRNIRTYSRH